MIYPKVEFENYAPTLENLVQSGFQPFDDTWNTYVPEHKVVLCNKILRAYWYYQIGQETPDRFKHYLNQTLEEVMPYYNQLYASELIKINPILNQVLTTKGKTLTDLAKIASTSNSEVAQAIRDFANSAKDVGKVTGNLSGAYSTQSERDITDVYEKEGTNDKTTDRTETIDRTENENTNVTTKETTDQGTTENQKYNATTTEDNTITTNRTENETDERTVNRTLNETKNETMHDEGEGSSNTTENMTQSVDGQKLYSDTPQKNLSTNSIRQDYLTNATFTSENTDRDTTTDTSNTYSEDKTTETTTNQTEETTDNTTIEKTITDTETQDKSKEEESTKDTTGQLDKTVDTTSNTTRTLTAKQEEDEHTKEDEDWTESGNSKRDDDFTEQKGTNEDTRRDSVSNHFDNGSSNESTSKAGAEETKENTKQNEDTETTMQGYINVSASALLQAFRETFLNVDRMIIEEVRSCFMEVF